MKSTPWRRFKPRPVHIPAANLMSNETKKHLHSGNAEQRATNRPASCPYIHCIALCCRHNRFGDEQRIERTPNKRNRRGGWIREHTDRERDRLTYPARTSKFLATTLSKDPEPIAASAARTGALWRLERWECGGGDCCGVRRAEGPGVRRI
jgi:hypothetical protein